MAAIACVKGVLQYMMLIKVFCFHLGTHFFVLFMRGLALYSDGAATIVGEGGCIPSLPTCLLAHVWRPPSVSKSQNDRKQGNP